VKQGRLRPPRDVVRQTYKALGDSSAYSFLESINFTCNWNETIVVAKLQASISTNSVYNQLPRSTVQEPNSHMNSVGLVIINPEIKI
jgi:hypothetical protein